MLRRLVILSFLCCLAACGSADSGFPDDVPTQLPPVVSRVAPATGPAGTVIQIFGFGFSDIAPNNVVIVGDEGVSATAYALVTPATATEIEVITATVPAGVAIGANSVAVVVYENVSNADITFTVTP